DYVVKKRGTRGLTVAQVQVAAGEERMLLAEQMRHVPFVRLARKGSGATLWLAASAGEYFSALGADGELRFGLGAEYEWPRWLGYGELVYSSGTEVNAGLTTADTL